MSGYFFRDAFFTILILAVPGTTSATATSLTEVGYKVTSGTVTFLAIGRPGFLRINGEGGKPTGHFTVDSGHSKLTSGEILVNLEAFGTGLPLRDRHMREKYLETKTFPDAVFKAAPLAFKDGKLPGETDLKGSLTLHGVTKPITANVKVNGAAKNASLTEAEIEADFEIVLSDFKVAIPEYAGVTVAEKVKVHISFQTRTENQ